MEKFTYKSFFSTIEVDLSREGIQYRKKFVPAEHITGFGIQITPTSRTVGNQFGLIGAAITHKMTKDKYGKFDSNEPNKETPFNEIPDKSAILVVAYKDPSTGHDAPTKGIHIPINREESECIRMLDTLKNNMPSKYIGIGLYHVVQKALNISNKAAWIVIGVIFALIGLALAAAVISEM